MPRQPRHVIPGQPMHITQRGNNRTTMFGDVVDYVFCLELLRNASERTGCFVHSYVLMGNHLHLLLTPQEAQAPARMMQRVGLSYVRYFNKRYGRTGTLWEGRYRSTIINSQRYFFACSRYIELNPVRAQLAQTPSTYRWSSFHRNATGVSDELVKPHALYRELGNQDGERQSAYLSLFANHIDTDAIAVLRSGYSGRRTSPGVNRGDFYSDPNGANGVMTLTPTAL